MPRVHPARTHPQFDQPGVGRRAGTTSRRPARARPTPTGPTARPTAAQTLDRPRPAGARARPRRHRAAQTRPGDGGRRHRRPARRRRAAVDPRCRRATRTTGARGARSRELRAWQRTGAHRIDRNRDGTYDDADRDPHHGRVVAAAGAGRVRARARGDACSTRSPGMNELVERPEQPRPAPRAPPSSTAGTATCSRTCARCCGRKVRGRYSRVYCGRGSLRALPRGAARLAARGAEGRSDEALRRRHGLRGGGPRRRPGLLRLDLLPAARRDHAAADAVAEPADVPAGRVRERPPLRVPFST